jgi:hypothetical protein
MLTRCFALAESLIPGCIHRAVNNPKLSGGKFPIGRICITRSFDWIPAPGLDTSRAGFAGMTGFFLVAVSLYLSVYGAKLPTPGGA